MAHKGGISGPLHHLAAQLCGQFVGFLLPFIGFFVQLVRFGVNALQPKPERLVDLLTGLRAARLEPKRIRFVRHRAETAVNLVLIESRLGGGPGLQYEPDLILYTQTGDLSAEGRRIYHLQE